MVKFTPQCFFLNRPELISIMCFFVFLVHYFLCVPYVDQSRIYGTLHLQRYPIDGAMGEFSLRYFSSSAFWSILHVMNCRYCQWSLKKTRTVCCFSKASTLNGTTTEFSFFIFPSFFLLILFFQVLYYSVCIKKFNINNLPRNP